MSIFSTRYWIAREADKRAAVRPYSLTALTVLLVSITAPVSADDAAIQTQLDEIKIELRALRAEVVRLQTTLMAFSRIATATTPKVQLDLKRALGSRNASVGMVEFSDYQ